MAMWVPMRMIRNSSLQNEGVVTQRVTHADDLLVGLPFTTD